MVLHLTRTTESFVLQVRFERIVVVFEGSCSLEPRPNLQADGVTLFQKDWVHPGSVRDSKVLGISCQLSTSEGMQLLAAANQVMGGWVMIDVGNKKVTPSKEWHDIQSSAGMLHTSPSDLQACGSKNAGRWHMGFESESINPGPKIRALTS